MKQFLLLFSIAIFSIFLGGQITEAFLLVPYWQSLNSSEFYSYYGEFGPTIGKFFTILTIVAALIPMLIAFYSKSINTKAFKWALISSCFAILFVASFYIYFKAANQLFYDAALNDVELKKELVTWSYWHWGRIVLEILSLLFLILSIKNIHSSESK